MATQRWAEALPTPETPPNALASRTEQTGGKIAPSDTTLGVGKGLLHFYTDMPGLLNSTSPPFPPSKKKNCDERVNPITTISTLNPRHGVVAKARATGST